MMIIEIGMVTTRLGKNRSGEWWDVFNFHFRMLRHQCKPPASLNFFPAGEVSLEGFGVHTNSCVFHVHYKVCARYFLGRYDRCNQPGYLLLLLLFLNIKHSSLKTQQTLTTPEPSSYSPHAHTRCPQNTHSNSCSQLLNQPTNRPCSIPIFSYNLSPNGLRKCYVMLV
uniref:Uncharacterized protein n=1 Tax=Cacopsylla melanoneura TaxID=428564 RepID=A0A8D8VIX5_9HEMI